MAALVTFASLLGACTGAQYRRPGTGAPHRGGLLNMLGTGDVDYMDPNISYYGPGYLALRMFTRQLFTYPATPGHTATPVADLATSIPTVANGGVRAGGLVYRVTIRRGAMWNTRPPRQVTAADAVLGLERTCNPEQPFGGLPDFEELIAGFAQFCDSFEKVAPTVPAIKHFLATNALPGVRVDPTDDLTVIYTLTHPATYFRDELSMPAFSPVPAEYLDYLPASAALAQHTLADGPYEINSYTPQKSIVFVRNPSWNPATDPVRKAYVDRVVISETGNQDSIQQELATGSASADMEWDTRVPTAAIPALLISRDPKFVLGQTYGMDYLVFNTVSPNNGGALRNPAVRSAVEYALDRADLVQDSGGAQVAAPLSHVLPPGISGSVQFDDFPHAAQTAKQKLEAALGAAQRHLRLVVLYQPDLDFEVKAFQTIQANLLQVGIEVTGLPSTTDDFYTRYMEVPQTARRGVWDVAFAEWGPDWFGDAAESYFDPLFAGPKSYPPGGSDFGLFYDPDVTHLTELASSAADSSEADRLWAEDDRLVMASAPIFPVSSPTVPVYHASQVHNAVFVPSIGQFDPTNVWLTPRSSGA